MATGSRSRRCLSCCGCPGLTDKEITVDTTVSHVDVAPHPGLISWVFRPIRACRGTSLLPMALRQGPWTPRVVPSEYGRSYSLRAANLRYIVDYSGKEILYDTVADPIEKDRRQRPAPHGPALPARLRRLLPGPPHPLARGHLGHAQQSDGRNS